MRRSLRTQQRLMTMAVTFGIAAAGVVLAAPPASAATFTVTSSGDGITAEVPDAGTLRWAITQANNNPGADVIDFDLPGEAPFTIQLTNAVSPVQALPSITEAVTIDGSTQTGYVDSPVVQIVEQAPPSARVGLQVSASQVEIYGLSLVGFGTGVRLTAASSSSVVEGNYLGINLAGNAVQGQQLNVGVEVAGGDDNEVAFNHISNAGTGVWVYGFASTEHPRLVTGNRIGIDTSNNVPLPVNEGILLDASTSSVTVSGNSIVGHPGNSTGIRLQQTGGVISVTGNRIGFGADDFASFPGRVGGGIVLNGATSSPSVAGNQIVGGSGAGLVVNAFSNIMAGGASGNAIFDNASAGISVSGGSLARFQLGGNHVAYNGGLGIDVSPTGVNPAPDAGPVINAVTAGASGNNSVTLTYDGPSSSAGQTVDVFLSQSSECDVSGFGEGESSLGSGFFSRVLDSGGDFSTTVTVDEDIAPGDFVTAMLSAGDLPSTEYSNCFTVPPVGNSAPVADGAAAVVTQGESVQIQLGGTDVDDDDLTFNVPTASSNGGSIGSVTEPACGEGSCTVEVTYSPPPGEFLGTDTFTYTVNDGLETSGAATVVVDVVAGNAAPMAQPGSFSILAGGTTGVVLYGTDADDDLLTFDVTREPAHGTVSPGTGVVCEPDALFGGEWTCRQTWAFQADAGYDGPDDFDFQVCDPSLECDTATMSVDIEGAQADLQVLSLVDSPDPVTATGVVAYTAVVKNGGPQTATNTKVVFADPATGDLPVGTSFVSGSVSSTDEGSGTCSLVGGAVSCTLGIGTVPASTVEWTVTVFLDTTALVSSPLSVRALVSSDVADPVLSDNALTEDTTVSAPMQDEQTEIVPPSAQTETVATADTVLVGGAEVPIAQPGDTTAAAVAIPPGGPGGVVSIVELACEEPFCGTDLRSVAPTPTTDPLDNRVVQFVPPFESYYDFRNPVAYSIVYDASVVGRISTKRVTALYTKDTDPDTLYQATRCPRTLTASTEFPCLKSAKVLKSRNTQIRGDLRLVLLGTFNDPKIAGFR